tara:strand:- start:28345 stop:30588 length:2244 start_codon:yes stop_codon:yes gene_type:complete
MSNVDIIIVAGYFILTLAVGIWNSRGVISMRDFSIGEYKFCNSAILATVVASFIGAQDVLGIPEKVFSAGLIFAVVWMANSFSLCAVAKYVAPRMEPFKGMISAGDIMHSFYGKPGRIITGCASILLSIGYIGGQIASIGYLCDHFLNIPHTTGILLGASIVVVYASLGGIRAVTATDVIQFLVLIIAIPVVCNVGLCEVGGVLALFDAVPSTHTALIQESHTMWGYLSLLVIVSVPFLDPVTTQRLLMAGSEARIKKSLYTAAIIYAPFALLIGFIGLIALAMNPGIDPALAFPAVVNNVLPEGLKGLTVAGMFAVIMSTADSFLNAASVTFAHDVVKPIRGKALSDKAELRVARLTSLCVGVFAIVAAISFSSIIDIILNFLSFWGPVIVVPLFAGIFGLRASTRTFLISAVCGFSTFLIWTFLLGEFAGFDSLIPSMLVSAATFFGAYFLEGGKSEQTDTNASGQVLKGAQPAPSWFANSKLKSFLPSFSRLCEFSQKRVKLYGAQYTTFGICAMLMYLLPFFMWSPEGPTNSITLILRIAAATLAGGLIFSDFWVQKEKALPLYWHFTLMYCLPFLTTYMLFKDGASLFWMMNMSLVLLFLAVLVDWLSFVIILPLGALLGASFYVFLHGTPSITLSASEIFLFFYMCFFSTLIGLVFSRNKEIQETLEREHALDLKKKAEQMSHDIRSPAVALSMFCKNVPGLSEQEREIITSATDRINEISNNLLQKAAQDLDEKYTPVEG